MDSKILKNLFKGTLATTTGTIFTMGFHFLSIFFLARYLSQIEFGYYALIFSISNLLNLFSNLGLEISIVKNIAEGSKNREIVLKPTLILKSLATLFILIFYMIFYKLYPTDGFEGLWSYNFYIIVLFILGSFRDLFYRVIQGLGKFKQYSIIQISTAALRVTLILTAIYFDQFNFLILIYFEISIITLSILLQLLSVPFRDLLKGSTSLAEYKNLLKFSSPLYANNLITFTYDRIGVFILGLFLTASSVAIFDISTKIPSALQGILSSYILVFFPNISSLFALGDNKSAEQLINKSVSYISTLLTILILTIALWNKEIVILFFSTKYQSAGVPLIIMMFSLLLRNLSNIFGYSIVAAGYSKIPMKVNFTSVIVGLASAIVFVIHWNFTGAAFAALLMNVVTFFQYSYYHKKLNLISIDIAFYSNIIILIFFTSTILIFGVENVFYKLLFLILFLILNYKKLINIVRSILIIKNFSYKKL
ncbi:oligosaccharide flippase family protein [Ignavibacterium sp.]|uniref:oligosaccharide flippase family protein n=1 Tax=Ignavibacterium sp. TaxID=2651167 RepID=UPI00307DBCA6